jgi:endothelin-converting enzyme/putative endopeptidase
MSILLLAASAMAFGQLPVGRGVETADMNRSIDPCTDFYEYANGTWRANNPIPPSMQRWSRRWAAGEGSKDKLKNILDDVSGQKGLATGSVRQQIGDFYAACMDEKAVNRLGLTPIRPYLEEIDALKSREDLQKLIIKFHDLGFYVPFGIVSSQDNHNPTQVIAEVFAAGLGLPDRDYYLKPEARFQDARVRYVQHVTNMLKLAGDDPARAGQMASVVMAMETKFAEASLDNVALRDPAATDHKMTFVEFEKLATHFDWPAYFKATHLPAADLNVDQPKFMQEFDRQLTEVPLAQWKIYLKWQVLHNSADALSQPFVDEDFQFYGAFLAGTKEIKPRWKRCVESTDGLLGEALGQEYVARYFPPEYKARVQEMVKNILLAMGDTIDGLDWMGPDTKKKALEKLATFNPKIGYPDKWKDYSSVKIRRDAYFADVLEGRRFQVSDDRARIGKPVDRGRWGMTPPTSDAYYNPQLNEIVFPAGILQPPAFNGLANDAVNYGSIGVVIGHEVSHGFDDQGAQYDALGGLNNWWSADDLKKFQAKTQCVVDQFESYYIEPTIHHNGHLVLGESIGDLGGAKIAYLAFKKSQQGRPPLPTIDGFTPDQQFFIAWGQFRGDAIRPETQRLMVQGDPHPIAKFRVIGPLSNLPAFQKAFSCPATSTMVRPPEKRCEVW